MYTRKCNWCGKTFETEDVDLDYCSIECFHADEEQYANILESEIEA